MPIEKIVSTIKDTKKPFENELLGITLKKQSELEPKNKWGIFLRAPTIYFEILRNKKVTMLGDIASVRRGITSGANLFFYLGKEEIKLWSLEREYLKPVLISPKEMKIEVKPQDIESWVLLVHKSKEELSEEKANVLKYIQWGEQAETTIKGGKRGGSTVKGFHNLSTVTSRKLWYDLGKREPAPILRSRRIWERCVYLLNKANALANDSLYEIRPKSGKDTYVLAGILNSSFAALISELEGRFYGGGVLELEVYETKAMTVIDPARISVKERQGIESAFSKVCEAQNKGDKKMEQVAKMELDNAVFDVLEFTERERRQVYEGLESLRSMRLQRKEVNVLVETAEKWKPHKVPKKKKNFIDPSKRLDVWMKEES